MNEEARLVDRLRALLECEAVLVAASLPAALAWAVAGLLRRSERGAALVLPLAHLGRLQGAPLAELIRLGGAELRPVGTVGDCPEAEFVAALRRGAAGALLFVAPEPPEVLAPARFLWLCRCEGVPAVVLDPASGRWAAWADGGAALVLLDGAALGGVACGLLAGSEEAIAACRAAEAAAAAFRAPGALLSALSAAFAASEKEQGRGT
ncbi:MAG: hypothetical protein NZ704_12945 [Geminicoccaceae bacterium]|nr:hypothetical protein [Geminicoccaceae bacterium]